MPTRNDRHAAVLITMPAQSPDDIARQYAAGTAEAAQAIPPGVTVNVTAKGRLDMQAKAGAGNALHVAVSLEFLKDLAHYNLNATGHRVLFTILGKLGETDRQGGHVHMHNLGEIRVTQQQLADELGLSRQIVNGALKQISQRNFIWKSGRGRYQIHPRLVYFGSAQAQYDAIAQIERHQGSELATVPEPGDVIEYVITPDGVTNIYA